MRRLRLPLATDTIQRKMSRTFAGGELTGLGSYGDFQPASLVLRFSDVCLPPKEPFSLPVHPKGFDLFLGSLLLSCGDGASESVPQQEEGGKGEGEGERWKRESG